MIVTLNTCFVAIDIRNASFEVGRFTLPFIISATDFNI